MATSLLPRLAREDFLRYIAAFNSRSYAEQHSFYSPNVTLTLPDHRVPVLRGPEAIAKHYDQVHGVAEETLVPMVVICEGNGVFFEMETYFRYTCDTDKGVHGMTAKANDVFKVTVWALYEIDEAKKMSRIRCNLWEEEMLGQVDVGELVRESQSRAQEDLRP